MSHGNLLYDGTQRVPLVLAGPGVAPGAVTPGPVGLARVAPTVRAFAGLPPGAGGAPLGLDGSDAGGSAYLETAYPRIHFGWSELYGLEREGWKYVVAPGAGAAGGGRAELRRVDASGEGPDELATRPDLGARLAAELAGLRAGLEGAAPGVAPVEGASLEALEALGYVGADLTAADSLGGDLLGLDPRLVIGANTAANLVRAALAMGDEPAARIQLAEIERLDPDGILLHESRGFVALARGLGAMGGGRDPAALDEALAAFEAATRLAPGRRGLWQKLAEVQLARDEPEAALLAARHAASLAPPPVALVELLGALEGRLAHELEAARSRGASARVEQLEQLLGLEPQP
jgi:tetratricopeptide (TPR) repeat protein